MIGNQNGFNTYEFKYNGIYLSYHTKKIILPEDIENIKRLLIELFNK